MPRSAIPSGYCVVTSSPLTRICPVFLRKSPMMHRSVVVLPAPFLPSSVNTSPSRMEKLTPCSALLSPYQACRSLSSTRGRLLFVIGAPDICLDHARIARDGFIVAFGEDAASCQHGDRVRQGGDNGKVVLHHQHRAVGGNLANECRDAV